jgi:Flp pilus assembly protein TadD/predicted Ser/Thr protein kinase
VQDASTTAAVPGGGDDRARPIIAGKFRVLREIGRGGMGVVYEAEDLSLGRTVALKFLPPDRTSDPEARHRFAQEARAASALDHVNICDIHEIGETASGEMFIAMARYRGESLKERLDRGPIPASEVMDLALQTAEGLGAAHEHGIVHRDLKPGNLFVTAEGRVKILDFGLAKLAGHDQSTATGSTMGTPAYMSPEQVRGGHVDARTDLWSLGVVLYEMATGHRPFRRADNLSTLHAILHDPPEPVKDLRPEFPAAIEPLIGRALSKDPGTRFASAREMGDALRSARDEVGIQGARPARRLAFRRRRRSVVAIGGLAAAAVVAAAFSLWLVTRPALAFAERDRLMVADVENLTGDKVFDLALRTAIEADLQQSDYAVVVDRPQIAETLRLMRKLPDTRVDEAVAYDVCRFAGARAFVLPRILSAGQAYELQAIIVDPAARRHVDRIRVTAKTKEDVLLHAIDEMAGQVRSRLGESLGSIRKADRPVTEVTTSSWDALNYLAMATSKWQQGKFKEAAALLELALENDPQFVDARGTLGLLYCQFLNDRARGKDLLKRALADAGRQGIAQRDLLKLKAVNSQFVDEDLPGALEQYRLIRELYPDFMPPWNNSGMILRGMGRFDEAAAMFEKAAASAPRNSIPLFNLWYVQIGPLHDARAAERTARRLVALSPELPHPHSVLGYSLAVQWRFAESELEYRKTLELEPEHPYAVPNLGHVLFVSGRPAEAVPVYRKMVEMVTRGLTTGDPAKDNFDLALALRESGNRREASAIAEQASAALLKTLKGAKPGALELTTLGLLAAAAGNNGEASRYLMRAEQAPAPGANGLMEIAELQAVLGRKQDALAAIRKARAAGYSDYFFPVIIPGFQSIRNDPEFKALFSSAP